MSLLGQGAVAIWHDIVPEGRADFYAWHGREHMPERVDIPGFRRGRRYIAIDAGLEFFNLYETDSPAVLTGEAYQARLNDPTIWTKSISRHFRRVARSLCRVALTGGSAQGGLMATWRCQTAEQEPSRVETALIGHMRAICPNDCVAGAHLLMADTAASAIVNAEEKARGERNAVPDAVILLEGWGDVTAFAAACHTLVTPALLGELGLESPPQPELYKLQITVSESDLA